MAPPSYRHALFLYVAAMVALFSCLSVYVVAPHRQEVEIGLRQGASSSGTLTENRKFSDATAGYIPEITEHLSAQRSGWLTLWSNRTELGRPLYHLSGFSAAYPPSFLLAKIVRDPWRFLTALSVGACILSGIFFLLFAREIGLSPLAGFTGGLVMASSPLFMYWLTFPMFPAVWCWATGALWALTRLAKQRSAFAWGVLSFSVYSMLMTAYPQPIVFHAYLLSGYGLWLSYRVASHSRRSAIRFALLGISAAAAGVVLALPVYGDLLVAAGESARVKASPSFFTAVLPAFTGPADFVRFVVLSTVPEIFGSPIEPSFPFPYDGLSITPIVLTLSFVALVAAFRKTWGWWLVVAAVLLFAFVHPLYRFGVEYLGFNLSRSNPLGVLVIPLTVLTAFGVDALGRGESGRPSPGVVLAGSALVLSAVALGVAYGLTAQVSIRWQMVLVLLGVSGLLAAQHDRPRPVLLMLATSLVVSTTAYPLMLKQDRSQIATASPLVDKVRAAVADGSRFAVAAPGVPVLQPNLNVTLGLTSLHSYNSLSATRYHALIQSLGGEVRTYGRWNGAIAPDYDSFMFWMSNVGLILAPARLHHANLDYLSEEDGVHLHRVKTRMGESLQVLDAATETQGWRRVLGDPRSLATSNPRKLMDQGDALEFEVLPAGPSLLLLSRKFHRDWSAFAQTPSGREPAQTVEVNGVFQGVLLPKGTTRVRLEFQPLARHAWIAHVFWALLIVLVVGGWWRKRRNNALERT